MKIKSIIIGAFFGVILSSPCFAWGVGFVGVGVGSESAGADYVAAKAYVYVNASTTDDRIIIGIYNNAGTLIGQSVVTTPSANASPHWVECTINSGPTLTAGQTYRISVTGLYALDLMMTATNYYDCKLNERGEWPSIPSTINPASDTEDAAGEFGIYVANAAGTRLIGNSTSASFTAHATIGNAYSNAYLYVGYTCVTQ